MDTDLTGHFANAAFPAAVLGQSFFVTSMELAAKYCHHFAKTSPQ